MPLFIEERKHSGGKFIGIAILIVLAALLFNYPECSLYYSNLKTNTRPEPTEIKKKDIIVQKSSESETGLRGRLFQHLFSQSAYTAGRSADELSIGFSQPVLLKGFLISVDCWKSTRLVEFAAGINQQPAYQAGTDADMLFHVSFATDRKAGKIDEHTWFPEPIALTPSDRLNIGAWIQNSSATEQSVSPEIIVYYSWASAPEPPPPRPRRFSRPITEESAETGSE